MPEPVSGRYHIFAAPDDHGHRIAEDGKCPCGTYSRPDQPYIILHRTSDGREYVEDAEAIINPKEPHDRAP